MKLTRLSHFPALALVFSLLFSPLFARGLFEKLGDMLTLAPLPVFFVTIGREDYEGAWQIAASTATMQVVVEGIKRGFEYAHSRGAAVDFAKRPINDDYKGMPSGHTAGAFSAASFVYHRYGPRPAAPLIGLGILTAITRIQAGKHTPFQTMVGAGLAWVIGYLWTTPWQGEKSGGEGGSSWNLPRGWLAPALLSDARGRDYLGLSFYVSW